MSHGIRHERDRSWAERRFAAASEVLARRWHGLPVAAPDWLCREAVTALRLVPGNEAGHGAALEVALRDGVGARDLPADWLGLRLVPVRQAPARAQRLPPRLTLRRTREDGTATALVRDRLNPERCFLLTCGHVVAPDSASRYGDAVRIGLPGIASLEAYLREWQPALGPGCLPTELDAALIEVSGAALQELIAMDAGWLPTGLSDDAREGMPVSLRRVDGPLEGRLCAPWSGEVGTDGQDAVDYFLKDGISYATSGSTQGGDSGGAIWSAGDRLFGMHVGAIESGRAADANAVMARVQPALAWYCVKPFTRTDPATVTAADWPERPPSMAMAAPLAGKAAEDPADADEQLVLARTLWGEARGEGEAGMYAVGRVILNRWRSGYRGCRTVSQVCLDPSQFSCWNANDPNRAQMLRLDPALSQDENFKTALDVATFALSQPSRDGTVPDPTLGARHYVATTLPSALRPDWLLDKHPCAVIGRHEFYNNIR
ncbi:cell wall hydrolase [Mitsuaria sp. GD03876]|uniref:cell wall hydrolase n=1 Tax=Mitsuaria sp. GD03876 TaxID=2975399 RepID=UPI0024468F7B|nr:cell wall hydrolase [Mitsuaria sp. GD03876]MDH0863335.1 cell wall hydrolase [Mitsuaria sp. GD03876]